MYAVGRFNISTIYRKLVYSNVQALSAAACCMNINRIQVQARNYSISKENKPKPPISHTRDFIKRKWIATEYKYKRKTNSDNIERKQSRNGLLSKTVDLYIQLPPAVKRKDLFHCLSSVKYSNSSFQQCVGRLEEETSSHILYSCLTGLLTVYGKDADNLKNAETKLRAWINSLLIMTIIIPVELPHTTPGPEEFKSIFVGRNGDTIKTLRKNTNSEIQLTVVDNSVYVVIHAQNLQTLRKSSEIVQSKIQDIFTNTETIPVDLQHVLFDQTTFKSIFFGPYGEAVKNMQKVTNCQIFFPVIDKALYVTVFAQDQNTLKKATDAVKSRIQDIITNTAIISLDLSNGTIDQDNFKSIFCGRNGNTVEMFKKNTNSEIKLEVVDNSIIYVIISTQNRETLKKAAEIVQSKIQDIFNNTETIPLDLQHVVFDQTTFKSIFFGPYGEAVKNMQKVTNCQIFFPVIDKALYVTVFAQDQNTLKKATDVVKSRIQDVFTNTEIIPVDLPNGTIAQENFKIIFVGKKGATINKLAKETNSEIKLNVIDNCVYVTVHAQDQDTLIRATDIVKSTVLEYQNSITKK